MKNNKKHILSMLLLPIFAIIVATSAFLTVHAGISQQTILPSTSVVGKIDSAYWWQPGTNAGVSYNNGIAFSAESTAASRVISVEKVENLKDAGYTKCFSVNIDLTVTSVPDGGRFGFLFGLSRQTENPAAEGVNTTFIYFSTNGNTLLCGISNYVGTARDEVVLKPVTNTLAWVSAPTASFNLNAEVDVDGSISLYLIQGSTPNQTTFYRSSTVGCYTAGHVGFGQTEGGSVVKITGVQVDALSNETPENTDIMTRFENDVFNVNELYTSNSLYSGALSYIRPENERLVFKNTKNGYLSTRLSYSNFEMNIGIPDLRRTPMFDENLRLVSSVTTGFSIAVGADYSSGNLDDCAFYVNFAPSGTVATKANATVITIVRDGEEVLRTILPEMYHFWSESIVRNRGTDIKAVMSDGKFSIYLKFSDSLNYYKALDYNAGYIASGCLQIVSRVTDFTAGVCDNFEIGFFSVVNIDYNRQIVRLTNKDNTAQVYDYEYFDTWDNGDLLFS